MLSNSYITKYNKIIYLICLNRDLLEFKKGILSEKYKLYSMNKITFNEYYNIYNKIYF